MSGFPRVTGGRVAGVVSLFCLVCLAADAHAGGLVTVNFQGVVTEVQDDLNIFAAVSVGTAVSGTYTYDGNAPSVNPGGNNRNYYTAIPPGRLEFQIGPFLFQASNKVKVIVTQALDGADYFEVTHSGHSLPAIGPESSRGIRFGLIDDSGTALSDLSLPLGAPNLALWTRSNSWVIYVDATGPEMPVSFINWDVTSVTLKGGGGTCSSDSDGDGIQNDVDIAPSTYTDSFVDTSTAPTTTGSFANRGDQDLCASDEPWPKGVRVESLSGGPNPATVELSCFGGGTDIKTQDLTSGECVILTCLSGPTAQVAFCPGTAASVGSAGPAAVALPVGAVELDLLRSGLVVATLVLPEGNSITYDPQTAQITAPASNNTTLNLVGRYGEQQPLAPGKTTTVPDSAIPATSTWGLAVLALALLVGAKVYFNRRAAAA